MKARPEVLRVPFYRRVLLDRHFELSALSGRQEDPPASPTALLARAARQGVRPALPTIFPALGAAGPELRKPRGAALAPCDPTLVGNPLVRSLTFRPFVLAEDGADMHPSGLAVDIGGGVH